jgi:hypothetical protein
MLVLDRGGRGMALENNVKLAVPCPLGQKHSLDLSLGVRRQPSFATIDLPPSVTPGNKGLLLRANSSRARVHSVRNVCGIPKLSRQSRAHSRYGS